MVLLLLIGVPTESVKFGKKRKSISGNVNHYLTEAKGPKRRKRKRGADGYDLI